MRAQADDDARLLVIIPWGQDYDTRLNRRQHLRLSRRRFGTPLVARVASATQRYHDRMTRSLQGLGGAGGT